MGYSPWGCKELDAAERLIYTRTAVLLHVPASNPPPSLLQHFILHSVSTPPCFLEHWARFPVGPKSPLRCICGTLELGEGGESSDSEPRASLGANPRDTAAPRTS